MKAFLVTVNGKHVCLAGIGQTGVLDVSACWTGSENIELLELAIGGMESTSGEQLSWEAPAVAVGDEILIKVVEVDSVDPASERYSHDRAAK